MKNQQTSDPVLSNIYASSFNIPVELAQIIAGRFPEYEEAKRYLKPLLSDLHDSGLLPDIDIVTDRLIKKIRNKEPILIYGHDDVDGFTSAVLMYKTLRDISRGEKPEIHIYIFDREKDGYILNPRVLEKYRQVGCNTIMTVDFGVSSDDNFRVARENNFEILVCDHHETGLQNFPVPVIDPKRPDSEYPFRDLAGVGVALKLALFLYQQALGLNLEEVYALKKDFFSLAMIGTIADRVTLLNENRVLCHVGLPAANQCSSGWLNAFLKNGEINYGRVISEIIPTIASAAYVESRLSIELLLSEDNDRINDLIAELKEITRQRRSKSDEMLQQVLLTAKLYENLALCIVPYSRQHYLGSIAARVRDHYKRAALIIGIKDDRCHGELRSTGLDLHAILSRHSNLFIDYGGHRKAAGFTAEYRYLEAIINLITKGFDLMGQNIKPEISTLPEATIMKDRVSVLQPMLPLGEGNSPPLLTDRVSLYTIDNWLNITEKGL